MRYLWRVAFVLVFIVLVVFVLKSMLYEWVSQKLVDLIDWLEARCF